MTKIINVSQRVDERRYAANFDAIDWGHQTEAQREQLKALHRNHRKHPWHHRPVIGVVRRDASDILNDSAM